MKKFILKLLVGFVIVLPTISFTEIIVVDTILISPGLSGIAVNPNTKRIYVADHDNDAVFVINGVTNNVVDTIPVRDCPEGVAVDSSTDRIYVSCSGDGTVWVLEDKAGIEEDSRFKITDYRLEVYPNPFTQKTVIELRVQSSELKDLQLQIYDLAGKLVKSFPITNYQSPITSIIWDRKDNNNKIVANGIYFCRLEASGKMLTKKMCLVK